MIRLSLMTSVRLFSIAFSCEVDCYKNLSWLGNCLLELFINLYAWFNLNIDINTVIPLMRVATPNGNDEFWQCERAKRSIRRLKGMNIILCTGDIPLILFSMGYVEFSGPVLTGVCGVLTSVLGLIKLREN